MPQYAGAGLGKARIKAIRITALAADCSIAVPLSQCVIYDCVFNISTDLQIEAGTPIEPRSANGVKCWRIDAVDNKDYYSFTTFQIMTWQMQAAAIMTGATLYNLPAGATTNGGQTFGLSSDLGAVRDVKFALEIWSTVASPGSAGSCTPTSASGNQLYWYELYPHVEKGLLGGAVTRDETTPHFLSVNNARGYSNPNWLTGGLTNPMPGGATLGVNAGEFMSYWVDANGVPLPLPAEACATP